MRTLFFLLAFAFGSAHAFPTKPARIIVAFPPGGGTDIVARQMGAAVVGNSAEEFGAAMRAESAQWADIIKSAGIKAE